MKGFFAELSHPREIIRNFVPGWFGITMGTGITGIVIANFPFPFRGMVVIGTIYFIANICMFCLFTMLFVARLVMFPETIFPLLKSHQLLAFGAIPMGLTTLTNYIILVVRPTHSWGLELAYVLWWIEFVFTLVSIFGVPYCMMRYQKHSAETMSGLWLFSLVPAVVTGASGCYLSRYLEHEGHRAPMILTISGITLGCGISLALPVIGIYFYRLVVHDFVSKDLIVSSFLPVGPLGQGTYGVIEMGWAFKELIGDKYAPGFGDSVFACCVVAAYCLWGYGLYYMFFAFVSLIVRLREGIPYNLGWWGLTFPIGVFTAGTMNIAVATDSRFFRGITSLFVCILVINWFVAAISTLGRIYTGSVFKAPCLQQPAKKADPEMQAIP
ncbi:hypothetical protein K493DRAFT_214063 [Basidiobolus meristosporus CBS 931.73]|uniref:C4-dicarboxylate transporter/malic acid transport protein n=1 Tax=Basidiobolus meristosporus CBS 931.73 TaxID=1314790 RepID=A0A1Y1YLX7_9FUNG|nr:hypothetical protein K493DRAFT_214063 [Basidiobolus meristosporus CBS 931.73]|eukprot:ORX98594.1 hypothetical protein K493DRAFT_214063 [Basidiobolus meristosporus CBS 931.73]